MSKLCLIIPMHSYTRELQKKFYISTTVTDSYGFIRNFVLCEMKWERYTVNRYAGNPFVKHSTVMSLVFSLYHSFIHGSVRYTGWKIRGV